MRDTRSGPQDRVEDTPATHKDEEGLFSPNERMFIERLDLTGHEGDVQRDGEKVTVVYYQGNERRALRRFIVENESIVRE